MEKIEFHKYTSCGNNFIIIDETRQPRLREEDKSLFSSQITNVNFGVGADGVLFLQPCQSDVLTEINAIRHYWDKIPAYSNSDFIFRIFEPNGDESYSCGNGLMCLASLLNRQYGIGSTRILTQVPTLQPEVITIGTDPQKKTNWANMGTPTRVPQGIVDRSNLISLDEDIDIVEKIRITFRAGDLLPFSKDVTLRLTGFLVYTGEPHFVIFPETGFSIKKLKNLIFMSSRQGSASIESHERRISFGSWLINHIGLQLNKRYTHIFPNGINVNFVRIPEKNEILEYRCFERGINKETLACGTGALAASFVTHRLSLIKRNKITVWPHRCRWYTPNAFILVAENNNRWSLNGKPVILLEGKTFFKKIMSETQAGRQSKRIDYNENIFIKNDSKDHLAVSGF